MEYTAIPVTDEKGEINYFESIGRDITERKKAEEEIRNLARFLSENTNPVLRIAKKGTILYANDAAKLLLSKWRSWVDEPAPEQWRQYVADILSSNLKKEVEVELEGRIFSFRLAPVIDAGYVNVYGRDITERRRAEEALRESEERYRRELEGKLDRSEGRLRSIFDNAPIGIILTDEEGNYIEVNERLCQLAKASREELLKLNAFKLQDERIRPYFEKALRGEICEYEGPYHTTVSGLDTWRRMVFAPILNVEGKVTGVVYLSEDITAKKRLEKLLLEKTRLASIGETAAMVGHDLRNPLQGIIGNVYLAKEKLKTLPSEEAEKQIAKNLEVIGEQVRYMDKIVSDLQDYARPLKPKLVPTSPQQLINDTLSMIKVPETVKASTVIPEDFPKMMIDPAFMRRVLTNLIINAVQSMPDGGQLTIKASKTKEDAFISVEDTGVGIPEENLPKIFTPLFTTKAKGQGLGLPVCKRLVEAYGGAITVESQVGKCSTFTVEIPLRREES